MRRVFVVLALTGIVGVVLTGYGGAAWIKAGQYVTTPPNPVSDRGDTPAALGIPFETVAFPTAAGDGLTLRGWWLPGDTRITNTMHTTRRTVVLVHGRYENRAAHLDLAARLWQQGYAVLLFDLRGHGDSDRAPCTSGLREAGDVTGAVRFALTQQGAAVGHIAVIGWSLGGASALIAMADTPEITAVVADSAYANADLLLAHNPLRPGLTLALRLRYGADIGAVSPESAVTRIAPRHVLLIHGTNDSAVPLTQAVRLRDAAGANGTFWPVADVGHTGAFAHDPDVYLAHLLPFLDAQLGS